MPDLIGALIGLARATDGSEHLINPDATRVIRDALAPDADPETHLPRIEAEKRKMVPDCFLCASPCGRTASYDMTRLDTAPEAIRTLKFQILAALRTLAAAGTADHLLYRGLIAIGMDDYGIPELQSIAAELHEANRGTAE